MSIEGYAIRKAARHEVDLTISWANSEGWNPGIHDAEAFYTTDANGFFVGILEGKPVVDKSQSRKQKSIDPETIGHLDARITVNQSWGNLKYMLFSILKGLSFRTQ